MGMISEMESVRTFCIIVLAVVLPLGVFVALVTLPVFHWLPPGVIFSSLEHTDIQGDNTNRHSSWGYGIIQSVKELLPKEWGKKYVDCDGSHQSPINFDSRYIVNNSLLTEVEFINYAQRPRDSIWTATNNGHTVQFTADFDAVPYVTSGGLENGKYYFRQFHYHWGSNDSYGSEHAINGRRFPIELHLVHVRNASDSSPYKVAVVGIFADVVDDNVNRTEEQEKLQEIRSMVEAAQSVRESGSTKQVYVPGFTLLKFLPKKRQFFRYYGSLTTPPCTQLIQWTVMANPIKISKTMLKIFRQVIAHSPPELVTNSDHDPHWLNRDEEKFLVNNFRPIQSTKGRVINYFAG
ncbi:carbonic anhydrase 7-like [Paramacrobiotus metropolitanus]|uniref:carbonic anhydrase 7-like n=1 Tax=Paramacrobiotus metropolitanus TaxID=2943436 RepID=UPI002445BC47|nr:carbonic anhydrase 7-like [Paramacrobiotus metropolitanus]